MNWQRMAIPAFVISVMVSAFALSCRAPQDYSPAVSGHVQNGESPAAQDWLPASGPEAGPAEPRPPLQTVQTQRSQQADRPATTPSPRQARQQADPQTKPTAAVEAGLNEDEQKMLALVNGEREKIGLKPLSLNMELTKAARVKAGDMIANNYFSHNSPTFGSPFDMMERFGIIYRAAGENLAGAGSIATAHKNLMNSEGHRSNILNAAYREIGIGVVAGGPYGKIFVQLFTG